MLIRSFFSNSFVRRNAVLKSKISGALKAHLTTISNNQHTILIPADLQFHPVTTFHFKCHMVSVAMVVMSVGVMMVGLSTHIYDFGWHSQSGRILVLKPLCNILSDNQKEREKEQNNEYFHGPPRRLI